MDQGPTSFPVTKWTMVEKAGGEDPATGRPTLGILLQRYLPAMRVHLICRKRLAPGIVDDVLQGFVAHSVLERGLLSRADRNRGSKFRSFLLTALDNFLADWFAKENAKKRSPEKLNSIDAESDVAEQAIAVSADPNREFDVEWARQLLSQTLHQMKQECGRTGRMDVWDVFDRRIRAPLFDGEPELSYEQMIERFGFKSPTQAANLLITAKRTFQRVLRQVVGQYIEDENEIDNEIADLIAILSTGGAGFR